MVKNVEEKIRLDIPITDVWEKSSDGEKSRKIGGYASTESMDREGEIVIQKGLDFSDFLQHGWFKDEHIKKTTNVVGYPTKAEFHKGKGWWVEGYLIKGYKPADDIWELANALKKSGGIRGLCYSIEGGGVRRSALASHKIVKAKVTNVAITNKPVNPECRLEVLAKSFCDSLDSEDCISCNEECVKAMEAGSESNAENLTGGGALREQSLEGGKKKKKCKSCTGECGDAEKSEKTYTREEIIKSVMERGYSEEYANGFYRFILSKGGTPTVAKKEVVEKSEETAEEEVTQDMLEKSLAELEKLNKSFPKKGKDEKKEEKEDEDDDEDDDEKSFADEAVEDSEEIAKAVEVTDFLDDLVKAIGKKMDSFDKSIKADSRSTQKSISVLAGGMASIIKSIQDISKRQDEIEKKPVSTKKSITSLKAKAEERFEKSQDSDEEQQEDFSRGEVSKALADLAMRHEIPAHVVSGYEGTGRLQKSYAELVVGEIRKSRKQ